MAAARPADDDPAAPREDALHVGATRPAMLLGLPMVLSVALLATGYFVWVNVTGLAGMTWAATVVGPAWLFCRLAVSHDLYGINVLVGWLRTSGVTPGRGLWSGATRSPVSGRPSSTRPRAMVRHA